jgi:hypothetical protein
VVSLVDKEQMRVKQGVIQETLKAWNKSMAAERTIAATAAAQALATEAHAQGKGAVVCLLEFGADGKVAKKIQDVCKGINTEGSFFIASLDEEGEKLGLFPIVSAAHMAAGMNAKEWCDHAIAAAVAAGGSGKGGGQGGASECEYCAARGRCSGREGRSARCHGGGEGVCGGAGEDVNGWGIGEWG